MYTKILLLVAISIIISSSVSLDLSHLKTVAHTENTSKNSLTPTEEQKPLNNLPLGIDWSDVPHQDTNDHSHSHSNNDDDGKSHHFHFEHFTNHRRRTILIRAFAKLILLITFVSSLISGFYLLN